MWCVPRETRDRLSVGGWRHGEFQAWWYLADRCECSFVEEASQLELPGNVECGAIGRCTNSMAYVQVPSYVHVVS